MPSPFQPIPGTGKTRRGVFVNHWGCLLRRPAAGFASDPSQVEFLPGAIEALFQTGQQGWNIYLIGNEGAVPQGQLSLDAWQLVQEHLLATLRSHGVPITRNYICTDDPEGKPPHDKDSVYLLPNTGAMYHAAQHEGIDLTKSWVLADDSLALVAGWRAGCHTVGIRTGRAVRHGLLHMEPEVLADDLLDALSQVVSGITSIHR